MPVPQYGDYQMEIYGAGLQGKQPRFPLDYASLEQAAAEVLPFWVYSYVGYGAGDGNTQRANVDAFSRCNSMRKVRVCPSATSNSFDSQFAKFLRSTFSL